MSAPACILLPETWLHTTEENRNPDRRPGAGPSKRKKGPGLRKQHVSIGSERNIEGKKTNKQKKMQGRDAASQLNEAAGFPAKHSAPGQTPIAL